MAETGRLNAKRWTKHAWLLELLLRASNQFASISQVNTAIKTNSLPSNHRENHLRQNQCAIGVQCWVTYTSVSLIKSPCIGSNQHLSVLKSSFLYVYPFTLPPQTFEVKGIMKLVTLLWCQVEYQVMKKPARSVIEHVWSIR